MMWQEAVAAAIGIAVTVAVLRKAQRLASSLRKDKKECGNMCDGCPNCGCSGRPSSERE